METTSTPDQARLSDHVLSIHITGNTLVLKTSSRIQLILYTMYASEVRDNIMPNTGYRPMFYKTYAVRWVYDHTMGSITYLRYIGRMSHIIRTIGAILNKHMTSIADTKGVNES